MKRKAEYDINENNCEDDPVLPTPDLGKISTPEEIANRRILKVKGHKTEESSTPAKLVLLEKLSEAEDVKDGSKNEEEKVKSSETTKKEENKQSLAFSTTSSLFGNTQENKKTSETKDAPAEKPSGLFGNLPKTTSSLFGSTNSTSLFGAGAGAGTGLFANLSSSSNGGLSFLSGAKNDETKPNFSSGGLFGSGLFGNTGTSSGLFSGLSKPAEGSSLFDKPISSGSGLFGIQGSTQAGDSKNGKAGSDDEGGEGEDDDEQEHSPEIDESKVPQYQYVNPFEKVISKQVVKVRKGTNDILEKGFISLEKNIQDEKAPHIFVYRDQIKKVIFTYNVIRKISKVEKINNSTKNLKVILYRKGETGGLVSDIIKVQFNDEKEGEEFFEKIKSAAEAEA